MKWTAATSRLFGEPKPPSRAAPLVFDSYEPRAPSPQNAIDALPGWNSRFPEEYHVRAGNVIHFADERIVWAIERYGAIAGANVLELGPMEGAHTYLLHERGANVVAVEANKRSFLKCLVTKEIVGLPRAKFLLGDGVAYLEENETRYDLVVACGVLYHMIDPLRLLEALANRTDALYIWTSYIDPSDLDPDSPQAKHYAKMREAREFRGAEMILYPMDYMGAQLTEEFSGGIYNQPRWMARESILEALRRLGFADLEIAHEAVPHPGQPCFSIFARKRRAGENS